MASPITGYCNCGKFQVKLKEAPVNSLICHCYCCRRAGGAFAVLYRVNLKDAEMEDPESVARIYEDTKTDSGQTVRRRFCSSCGSTISSETPGAPDEVFLAASLFDDMAPAVAEIYVKRRAEWMDPVKDAAQMNQPGVQA